MNSDMHGKIRGDIRRRSKLSVPAKPAEAPAPPAPIIPAVPAPPAWPDEVHFRASTGRLRGFVRRSAWVFFVLTIVGLAGLRVFAQGQTVRGELVADTVAAKTALQGARDSFTNGDYGGSAKQFRIAETALHQANNRLLSSGQLAGAAPGPSSTLATGSGLLVTGELVSRTAANLADDAGAIQQGIEEKGDPLAAGRLMVDRLPQIQQHLKELDQRLGLLEYQVDSAARGAGTAEIQEAARELAPLIPGFREQITEGRRILDQLPGILGVERFKQYLIWFQNPAEIRATGGFIGTYGRLTLDDGVVKELFVDSIYNPANQANAVNPEPAPEPYKRFFGEGQQPIWGMQDANWSPNLPTSAKKFQSFYEKSGGSTTDGVLAITINPVVELLRIVGPIEMPEYGYVLDADNFHLLIQNDQLNRSLEGDQDPKRILREFAPRLLAKLAAASPPQKKQALESLAKAVDQKEIQLFFNNDQAEDLVRGGSVEGILPTHPSMLSVIDTNIAGRKSSKDIETSVDQAVTVGDDGAATVTLKITRRHTGATSPDFNWNFMRIYLPDNSEVERVEGFGEDYTKPTQTDDEGFHIVGGWTDLQPGGERTVTVTYRLLEKFKLGSRAIELPYYKQAGTTVKRTVTVTLPSGYTWADGQGTMSGRDLQVVQTATTDLPTRLTFTKD